METAITTTSAVREGEYTTTDLALSRWTDLGGEKIRISISILIFLKNPALLNDSSYWRVSP